MSRNSLSKVKLQRLQGIRLNDIPADEALSTHGELGDYIPVFLGIPFTQIPIVEEQ